MVEADCRRAVALNPPIRTRRCSSSEVAEPDSTRVDDGEKVDLYGQTGLRHYWYCADMTDVSVDGHQGTGLRLVERLSAERAVALLTPVSPGVPHRGHLLLP